jgi:hypothetical protein
VAGARAELAEVRRRPSDLADTEAALVVATEVRSRRVDDLLDERLRAAAPARRAGPAHAGAGRTADGARRTRHPRRPGGEPLVADSSCLGVRDVEEGDHDGSA